MQGPLGAGPDVEGEAGARDLDGRAGIRDVDHPRQTPFDWSRSQDHVGLDIRVSELHQVIDRYNGADGRGLGWFCLFVAITAVPVSIQTLQAATTLWGTWLGLCWAAWAVLWLLFFILLVMQKPIGRFVGMVTVLEGILTGWLPGYLLLTGMLH